MTDDPMWWIEISGRAFIHAPRKLVEEAQATEVRRAFVVNKDITVFYGNGEVPEVLLQLKKYEGE